MALLLAPVAPEDGNKPATDDNDKVTPGVDVEETEPAPSAPIIEDPKVELKTETAGTVSCFEKSKYPLIIGAPLAVMLSSVVAACCCFH